MKFCQRCGGKLYQDGTCPNCDLGENPSIEKTLPVNHYEYDAFQPGEGYPDYGTPSRMSVSPDYSVQPEAAAPPKKKKLVSLLVICICAAVLIAGVIYGAILLSDKDKEEKKPAQEEEKKPVATVCKHKETETVYEPQEAFGEHTVKIICTDETCAEQLEENTEACVDEDDDQTCDLCGMGKFEEVGEEDGWKYGISENGTSCTVIRYTDNEVNVEVPEKLGGVAVTTIAPYAFADADAMLELVIPANVTICGNAVAGCEDLDGLEINKNCVLEAMAFADCKKLGDVNVLEGLTIDPEAFIGCEELRCASYVGADVFADVQVPDDFHAYDASMDVGVGELKWVDCADDIVYGKTYDGDWVVLDFPNDQDEIEVYSTACWIVAEAVEGLDEDTEISLDDETFFAPEILHDVDWSFDDNTLTCAWIISCGFCELINEENGGSVEPDAAMVRSVMKTAEELGDGAITDGDQETTIASKYAREEGISFRVGDMDAVYYAHSDYGGQDEALDAACKYVEETLVPNFAEGSANDGYYERIALHLHLGEDGIEVCVVAIIE